MRESGNRGEGDTRAAGVHAEAPIQDSRADNIGPSSLTCLNGVIAVVISGAVMSKMTLTARSAPKRPFAI